MEKEIKKVTETYENLNEEAKESISKIRELIEKSAMDPQKVADLLSNNAAADAIHPELKSIEKMSSAEYAKIYKEMAEEIKEVPEKYEKHVAASGMSPDDLAILFAQIHGTVERYPEVWESKENAQLLHPKNLAILVHALKGDKE